MTQLLLWPLIPPVFSKFEAPTLRCHHIPKLPHTRLFGQLDFLIWENILQGVINIPNISQVDWSSIFFTLNLEHLTLLQFYYTSSHASTRHIILWILAPSSVLEDPCHAWYAFVPQILLLIQESPFWRTGPHTQGPHTGQREDVSCPVSLSLLFNHYKHSFLFK